MTEDALPLIPDVPEELRVAAQLGRLIPFVGAGVSVLAGCPSWKDFADSVLKVLVDSGKMSFAQIAQLDHLLPRVKLTLALALAEEHHVSIPFGKILHPHPKAQHAVGRQVYAALSRLGKTFVTTNYDEWLDDRLDDPPPSPAPDESAPTTFGSSPRNVLNRREEFTAANLNKPDTVLHLHGSVRDPGGMVITTAQYVVHYANDRRRAESDGENSVLTFLADLFQNKTVLFVGYGLQELEILEYVVLKSATGRAPREQPKHFLLQGYFSHELELMREMRRYYRTCGIGLLPFLMDQQGHTQLVSVIESLGKTLPARKLAVLQVLTEMESWING